MSQPRWALTSDLFTNVAQHELGRVRVPVDDEEVHPGGGRRGLVELLEHAPPYGLPVRSTWPQTLEGSFSAVSKPDFVSKYAFESSRRDLHNALLCTALICFC